MEACAYRDTRRNVSPAIYSVRRELERPIPNVVFDEVAVVIEQEQDRHVDVSPGGIDIENRAEQRVVERLAAIDIVNNGLFSVERHVIEQQIEHNIDNAAIEIQRAMVHPGEIINANNSIDSLNRGELQVDEQQRENNNEHEAAGQEAHCFQPQNELDLVNNGEVAVLREDQANFADESSVKIEVHVGSAANYEIESLLRDEVQLENVSNIEAMPELSFEYGAAENEEETPPHENSADPISTSNDEIVTGSEIEGAAGSECAVILYSTDEAIIESAPNRAATSAVSYGDDTAANQEETYSENDPDENDAISSHSEKENGPNENADDISTRNVKVLLGVQMSYFSMTVTKKNFT